MASSDPPSGERDVFSGLPNARPQRRSAKRDAARAGAERATEAKRPAKGGGAERATQAKPAGSGAKTRPAPKKAPPQARAAAGSRPSAAQAKSAAPKPPPVPPAGYATPTDDDGPRGADLVGTAVQAAGELAQIGFAFGGRALKSAIQRLPRP
jgi:hypothetical protein